MVDVVVFFFYFIFFFSIANIRLSFNRPTFAYDNGRVKCIRMGFCNHAIHTQTFNLCLSFDQQEPNSMNFFNVFLSIPSISRYLSLPFVHSFHSISLSFTFNSTICSSLSSFLFNASSNLLFDLRLSFVSFSTCILCILYENVYIYSQVSICICVVNIIRRNIVMMNFVCVLRS